MREKNYHLKHILTLLICILCLYNFSTSNSYAQDTKKQSDKKKDDEKLEIAVNVNYFLLDVIAFDKEGRHLADLTKDDFELFIDGNKVPISTLDLFSYQDNNSISTDIFKGQQSESELIDHTNDFVLDDDGFENDISPYNTDLSSFNSQPPRTFVIVFANLPMLPARWRILKEGLIDYINNYTSNNVQIAVFSMGMSDLGVILPFTRNKSEVIKTVTTYLDSRWKRKEEENYNKPDETKTFDLDEESDYFYIMADSATPNLDHSTSSWIISGFDQITIQQNTVFALFKQFDIIINKLSEIPGRKNLLLFSEGFPYTAETMSEYIRTRDRMRLLVSRMNRFNISLYTFDMFTSRNLHASAVRGGLLSDLSSSTNGAFFKWLGNSKTRISRSLVQTDILTSCYYLVGFYIDNLKIDEDTRAEVKVKREDVTLLYNEWLGGKSNFSAEKYLKEMESSRKLVSTKKYHDLPNSVIYHYLPGTNGKTWLTVSTMFPSLDVILDDDKESGTTLTEGTNTDLDAELLLIIENKSRKEKHYALKKIEIDSDQLTTQVTYNYRILLNPGLYKVKIVLHSLNNEKTATAENEITVPDYYFDELIHSLVLSDNKGANITIQNPLHPDNQQQLDLNNYPFYPNGSPLLLANMPKFKSSDVITAYIYCRKTAENSIINSPKITLLSEDESIIPLDLPLFHEPFSISEDFQVIQAEITLPKLKPGKYLLHSQLNERDNNGSEATLVIVED